MYSVWGWLAVLTLPAIVIWLGFLTFLVWQRNSFLKSLFPKSGERDIRKKFEEVVAEVGNFRKELKDLEGKLISFEDQSLKHIQRVELLRFNPYQETGGDQSFTACFLDERGNGFVITSLHARSATRVFAKPIKEGKAEKYQLSAEEEAVIKKALKS